MSTLAELVDLVEAELKDSANAIWSAAEIQAHIRTALRDYNRIDPQRSVGTIASVDGQREYALSTLTGLLRILEVWFPYNSTTPQHPPNRPTWSTPYDGYLRLEISDAPSGDATEKIRVFYTVDHTINGLDAAGATTLNAQAEQIMILGAAAFAVQQQAQYKTGRVNVSADDPKTWLQWAEIRLHHYREAIRNLIDRRIREQDARAAIDGTI